MYYKDMTHKRGLNLFFLVHKNKINISHRVNEWEEDKQGKHRKQRKHSIMKWWQPQLINHPMFHCVLSA